MQWYGPGRKIPEHECGCIDFWYYNLAKRAKKGRQIVENNGKFITLKTSYSPDWFIIPNYDNMRIVSEILMGPTWGVRRNIDDHFTYETGVGIGYIYYFAKNAGYSKNEDEATANLHLRIGYRF